jgi:hypothetical protein
MAGSRKSNNEMTKALKDNLQSSHFNMGNSGPEMASSSHANYKKHNIGAGLNEESDKLAKKMRGANFSLGNNNKMDGKTTYNLTSRNTCPSDYAKHVSFANEARLTNIKTNDNTGIPATSEASSKFTNYENKDILKERQQAAAKV